MIYRWQQGASLIELLVALTLFAIGILAIVQLQFLSFRNMNQGLLRAVAIQQVANVLVRYRVLSSGDAFNNAWRQWQAALPQWLPQARTDFSAKKPYCTLHLTWQPLTAIANEEGMPPIVFFDQLNYSG